MQSDVVDNAVVNAAEFNFEDELNDDNCEKGLGGFCFAGTKKVAEDLQRMENCMFNQKGKKKLNQFNMTFDNQLTINVVWNALSIVDIQKLTKKL